MTKNINNYANQTNYDEVKPQIGVQVWTINLSDTTVVVVVDDVVLVAVNVLVVAVFVVYDTRIFR